MSTLNYTIKLKDMNFDKPEEIYYNGHTYVLKEDSEEKVQTPVSKKDCLECFIFDPENPVAGESQEGDIDIIINGSYAGSIIVNESGRISVILLDDTGEWVTRHGIDYTEMEFFQLK